MKAIIKATGEVKEVTIFDYEGAFVVKSKDINGIFYLW